MKRRDFIAAAAALPAACAFPRIAFAQQLPYEPKAAEKWRTFEVVTKIEVQKPQGVVRAWVPVPAVDETWQRIEGNSWTGNAKNVKLVRDGKYGASMVVAEWAPGDAAPVLTVTSQFATRDRATAWGKPIPSERLDPATRRFYTESTDYLPTDGIVRQTALEATRGRNSDLYKAQGIYDWIVVNTFRDPKTRGCGIGDVKSMLESGNLGGKCADLNALFVAMARSVGLPARDMYGLRVAKSQFNYRSLGVGSNNVTRAQHCRAEVFLAGYGWVPVDPADVRKVVLEEKPQPTTLDDPLVKAVRPKLFGAWEMNWLAYNSAHDIALPGSTGPKVPFLMYPQAETAAGRLDSLDPDVFRYTITSREITPA
jgi:transglutaminase-like putative cysteine protease